VVLLLVDVGLMDGANPITFEAFDAPSETTVDATARSAVGATGCGIISIGGGAAKTGGGIPGGSGAPGAKLGGSPGGSGCIELRGNREEIYG